MSVVNQHSLQAAPAPLASLFAIPLAPRVVLPSRRGRRTTGPIALFVLTLFLASVLAHPTENVQAAEDAVLGEPAVEEGPRSAMDLKVYALANSSYALYSENSLYTVLFKNRTSSENAVFIADLKGRSMGFSPISVLGLNAPGRAVSDVEASRARNMVSFQGAYGDGIDLSYEATFNGVKEALTLAERPSSSSDLAFRSQLFFDSDAFLLASDDGEVADGDIVDGPLYLKDKSGVTVFLLPQAFVMDSPRKTFDEWRNRDVDGPREHLEFLSYEVTLDDGKVFVDVVLPSDIHQNEKWVYPLVIDPSIVPSVSTSVLVEGQTIVQDNNVNVTSGGTLTIRNSTIRWDGPLTLSVKANGNLVVENSTFTGNSVSDTYTLEVLGRATIANSTINHTLTGIRVDTQDRFWLINTDVSNSSQSGVFLTKPPSDFAFSANRIHNNGVAGVEILANITNGVIRTNDSEVYSNWIGVKLLNAQQTNNVSRFKVHDNGGYGVYCNNSKVSMKDVKAWNNPRAVYGGGCDMNVTGFSADGSTIGVEVYNTDVLLDEANITQSSSSDLFAGNSDVTVIGGNYPEWIMNTATSELEVQVRVDIRVVNASGGPLASMPVTIKNVTGNIVVNGMLTDANGRLNQVILRFFVKHPGNEYTFFSPHLVEVATNPTASIHYFVGGRPSITIYATGDADNDGRVDAVEDTPADAWWFEAESMSRWLRSTKPDFSASGGVVLGHSNGSFFRTLGWPELEAGTYQFGFLADNFQEGKFLNFTAVDSNGNSIVSNTTYWITRAANWYWSPSFTLDKAATVYYQLTDLNGTEPGAIRVDNLVIVRTHDENGARTSALPGQVTDPLSSDTDSDYGNDSLEVPAEVFHLEAELLDTQPEDIALASAFSGRVAEHVDGSRVIVAKDLTDLSFTHGDQYELWVRARKTVSNAADVKVTLRSGSTNSSSTITLTQEFDWYRGPSVTYWTGDTVVISAEDDDDSDVDNGPDWVQVDAIILANTEAYPNETLFGLSDPLLPDTDADGVEDGSEINGYFMADIHQGLNYTVATNATVSGGSIYLNQLTSSVHYEFEARTQGIYKLYIPVKFGATEGQSATPQYTTMSKLLKMALNDTNGNPIPIYDGEFAVFDYAPDPYFEGAYRQFATAFQFLWDLPAGNYNLTVYVNTTAAQALAGLSIQYSARVDSIFIERFRLNSIDRDSEDDNVTDGVEVMNGMMPLRDDSDYDLLSDWEEYYVGNDGFLTNPVFNDTDHDGLTDGLEEGLAPDADPGSTTNPASQDTDGDGIPDGWVDGWFADLRKYDWDKPGGFPDGIRQPWEGEDLNLDGEVQGGAFSYASGTFATTGGETDPTVHDSDADGMDDGWELFYRGDNGTTVYILNPLQDDAGVDHDILDVIGTGANGDGTGDNLTNLQEYALHGNPFSADIDHDFLEDGTEQKVAFRTNVTDGAYDSEEFRGATLTSWIYWDSNPYDDAAGAFYNFSYFVINGSASSPFNSNWTQRLTLLRDGALLARNVSLDQVYLWFHIADHNDAGQNGILEGTVAVFDRLLSTPGPTSSIPQTDYARRELGGGLLWNDPDSDHDGLIDGYEGWPLGGDEPYNDWSADVDLDGIINALDPDSDNDGLPDGLEWKNGDKNFDPAEGETHAFASDTDNDGINDGNDSLPLDYDNDYLTGYLEHSTANGTILDFDGVESIAGTNPVDPDTDNDGLMDGIEDANRNGTVDVGETSPLDMDTDDDGLWDGPAVWDANDAVVKEVANGGYGVDNVDTIDSSYASFLVLPWYVEHDLLAFTSVDLDARAYLVHANLSAWTASNNSTFEITVYLDEEYQFTVSLLLYRTGVNWTTYTLGAVVSKAGGASHNVSIQSSSGRFYLKNITLVAGDLGESYFGTNPLSNDTDGDGLQDGFEVSLATDVVTLDNEVSGGGYAVSATNSSRIVSDNDTFRSDPTLRDTDRDGLWDGYWLRTFWGELRQFGEKPYNTDPSHRDTDGDGWDDWNEVIFYGSSATDTDTDGDGLPDTYEPWPKLDYDNDTLMNVLDPDSDADTWIGDDRDSQEQIGGNWYGFTVVFRTNASHGNYAKAGVWVAIAQSGSGDLTGYVYESVASSLPGGATRLNFATTFGSNPYSPFTGAQGVTTFEGWPVFVSTQGGADKVHILLPNRSVVTFTYHADTSGMQVGRDLTWSNARDSNYLYRETINWSAMLLGDPDNDGLDSSFEEDVFHTDPSDADSDNDGLPDGAEYTLGANGSNADTDQDGLGDGFEVYWFGSLPSLNDSDRDGLWDGNFTWFSGHTINRTVGEYLNLTEVRNPDTDNDSLPDGWELFYYLNPKNADDAVSDNDLDWADAWEEYTWNLAENWTDVADNVSWSGTDPTDLDSDSDLMPDGYEMYWGLNPRNATDNLTDPDGDGILNQYEYNWSIVNASWDTPHASWYYWLTLDPFSNDTDADGISDPCEMNYGPPCGLTVTLRDGDHDGQANGVDIDSDNDGLWDDEEMAGWNVSILPAWFVKANTTEFLDENGDINWTKFPIWANNSDPYDSDTDNDSLLDGQEFWNGSNPRNNDTDGDYVLDFYDWTPGENNSEVSLRTVQDMDGPEIAVNGWSLEACLNGGKVGTCANITMTLRDAESGVHNVSVQHIGSGWRGAIDFPALFTHIAGHQTVVNYWMAVPISGVHDAFGTFRLILTAQDNLGNENSIVYVGGTIFDFYRATAKSEAWPNGTNAAQKGWFLGYEYGKDSGSLDQASNVDDILAGCVSVQDMYNAMTMISDLDMQLPVMYQETYLEYMRTMAIQINPYLPTLEDLTNLNDDNLTLWMRNEGAQQSNASAWLRFAKAFWDGSVAGGIFATAAFAVGGALVGNLATTALKALPSTARMLSELKKVMGFAWRTIRGVVAEAGTRALEGATMAAVRLWTAMRAAPSFVEEAFHRFWIKTMTKLGPDAMTGRAMQAFANRIHDFERWWGNGVTRITDAASGAVEEITQNLRILARLGSRNPSALADGERLGVMAASAGDLGSGARTLIGDVRSAGGEQFRTFLQDGREFRFSSTHGYDQPKHLFPQSGLSRDAVEHEILDDIHLRGTGTQSFPIGFRAKVMTGPNSILYDCIQVSPGVFRIPTYRWTGGLIP